MMPTTTQRPRGSPGGHPMLSRTEQTVGDPPSRGQLSKHPGDPLCPASSLLTLFLSEKTSIIPENPDLENE